jgi:drug/metabolite transporter (DMT)-like permease
MKRLFVLGFIALLSFDTMAQVTTKLLGDAAAPMTFDLAWALRIFAQPWVLFVIVGYVGAFVTYMTLLRHAPVGPTFAASHLEIVTVLIVSIFALGERLTLTQIIGAAAITTGVLILAATEADEGSASVDV